MDNWLSIYLKGFAMGAADSVPGVSGGTIALITGIYERLIAAIAAVDAGLLVSLAHLHTPAGRGELRDQLTEVDLPFLLPLGAGIATALITLTRVLHAALNTPGLRAATFAFFFGLIAASAVVLYRHVAVDTPGRIAAAVVGFAVAFLLSAETSGAFPHSTAVVFLTGVVAISAMILPGVSGAFLLVLFGQYEFMTGALRSFVDGLLGLATGGSVDAVVESSGPVLTFIAGALVGLLTISRIVEWALDNYRAATLTFLVSLMVGALRLPVEKVLETDALASGTGIAAVLAAALVGGGAVLLLDYYTDDLEYGAVDSGPKVPRGAD